MISWLLRPFSSLKTTPISERCHRTPGIQGLTATGAPDGEEALHLLRDRFVPSVILLDLAMPRMDGWHFRVQQTRDPRLAAIPVIIVWATGTPRRQVASSVPRRSSGSRRTSTSSSPRSQFACTERDGGRLPSDPPGPNSAVDVQRSLGSSSLAMQPRLLAMRYSLAVLAVAMASVVRALVDPVLGDYQPFAFFYVAVAAAASVGGVGPALLAIVLGYLAGDWLFTSPPHELSLLTFAPQAVVGCLAFVIVGLMITGITDAVRTAESRAREREPLAYPITFYPGSTNPEGAGLIRVEPGKETRADVTMRPVQSQSWAVT
jgi:CheY-like chemotaxis protein